MIFGLVNKNSGPGWHRITIPLLLMPDTDVYVTNAITEEDFEKRKPSAVFYNRVISDDIIRLQGKYNFLIVCDVDDWWHLDPHHIMFKESKKQNFAEHQIKNLRNANVVTCTHERLADMIYPYNKNVVILPNAIPYDETYFPVKHEPTVTNKHRVFWQGSVTHEKDIELLRKTMKNLDVSKYFAVMSGYTEQVEWERMADCFTNYKKLTHVVLPGAPPHEYYKAYRYADVCVVPLLSTKFNKYKSNLKILEAAHSGLPVIASNVHPYKNMDGVMYVDKSTDWMKWLQAVDEWDERARVLKNYCDKEFNFEEINKRRAAIFH